MTEPLGPYTPVIRVGDWVITSGQVSLNGGSVGEQVAHALSNMAGLLEGEGASISDVVKTTVFMTDMRDYDEMNTAYIEAFGDHRPTRSAVAVAGLPAQARVEIEAWAYTGDA